MANIIKRNKAYQISVSCGYDTKGKQVRRTKTWKPSEGMTEKQIEKEVQRQAVLFEEECLHNYTESSNIKFQDFSEQWFREYAELKLKFSTLRGYHYLEKRIYKELGHLRIDKITPRHIQNFVLNLVSNENNNGKGRSLKQLSPKTIKHHIALISSVFEYAIKMQLVKDNPCRAVTLPNVIHNEKDMYTIEETQQFLRLLSQEGEDNFKYYVFFTLAVYTGFRRGELLGLEWKDIDFENCIITVNRTSAWAKEKGIYTDTPKTKSSFRSLKVLNEIINLLKRFKEYQEDYKSKLCDLWIEHDRLFTQWNGMPMNTSTPTSFHRRFCKRTGMRFVSNHSFRHLNASMLISEGVDVKTVQACLGHSDANTTLNIYAHVFRDAQVKAMNAISSKLSFDNQK